MMLIDDVYIVSLFYDQKISTLEVHHPYRTFYLFICFVVQTDMYLDGP